MLFRVGLVRRSIPRTARRALDGRRPAPSIITICIIILPFRPCTFGTTPHSFVVVAPAPIPGRIFFVTYPVPRFPVNDATPLKQDVRIFSKTDENERRLRGL